MSRWKRELARLRRCGRQAILEKHMGTLSARAAESRYQEWTQTPEYQKELDRLRDIARRIREEFGEDIQFVE